MFVGMYGHIWIREIFTSRPSTCNMALLHAVTSTAATSVMFSFQTATQIGFVYQGDFTEPLVFHVNLLHWGLDSGFDCEGSDPMGTSLHL